MDAFFVVYYDGTAGRFDLLELQKEEADSMKPKWLLLLLTAVFAVAFSLPVAVATDGSTDPSPLLSAADGFAMAGETLYFTVESRLYRWDENGCVTLVGQGIDGQLTGDTSSLYVLNFRRGTLTRLDISEADHVVSSEIYPLDSPALLDAAGALRLMRGYAVSGGWLYLLVESDITLKTDLLALCLASNQWKVLENQNIQAIAPCGDGSVVMASYDIRDAASGCEIIRYDASSGDAVLFASPASLRPEAVAFVPEAQQVCLEVAGTVYLCRAQDADPLPVAKISAGTPGGFACLAGQRYLSLRADGGIAAVMTDPDGMAFSVLTFAGSRSISPQDNPAFAQAYPLVTLRSRNDPPGTDYAAELITGAHAADIYLFEAASPQYRAVISKGYAMDLSQSEILTEAAASYAPFLSDALRAPDGALAAMPTGDISAPVLFEVYLEAWQAADLGPLPTTAQELLDACIAFSRREDLLSDGWRFSLTSAEDALVFKREMLQLVLQTYLAEFAADDAEVQIDTPAFRTLLEKYEEALPAMECLAAETAPLPSSGFYLEQEAQTCLLSYPGATLLPQDGPGIATAFLPLTVTPGAAVVIEADVTVFVINPASPNRDLALAYLETYAQNLSPHKRIQYIPAEVSPIEQESYRQDRALLMEEEATILQALPHAGPDESMELCARLEAVQLDLANLEGHRYATTAEMIEKYKALTPYLRIRTAAGLNFFTSDSPEMIGLLNQYAEGAIDLDRFIDRYAAMARMMQLESATD